MKKLFILAFILSAINGMCQTPFPVDNHILVDMKPVKIDDIPVIDEAEMHFEIIETEQEEEETEKKRVIFWIHGLGGNGASWSVPAQASEDPSFNVSGFDARYVHSFLFDYNGFTDGNLYTAANSIGNQIKMQTLNSGESFVNDRTRNFIIAHSQGGLVSREILHNDCAAQANGTLTPQERGYGGLVTVSSSLQGAQILNNQNMIIDMAGDACEKLTKGPLLTAHAVLDSSYFVDWVVRYIGRKLVDKDVCGFASGTIVPFLFKDNTSSITQDYYVGATRINTFNNDVNNNYYNEIPKVAFYGVEPRQNLLWRTAQWLQNAPHQVDPWQANDDWTFYNSYVHPHYNNYYAQYLFYKEKWETYYWVPALRSYYLKRYQAWRDGYEWLNNANQGWEAVIGALEYEIVGWHGLSPEFDVILKESDGVVLKESAINLPGSTHAPVILRGILVNGQWTGSSHMQVRNDDALKTNLQKLYSGDYGWFFYTKKL